MVELPHDYESWHHCITVQCGIPMTRDFVSRRLQALSDRSDSSTRRFVELYGEAHLAKVIAWFERADRDLP